eukprot:TRINITY_DN1176_c0_g1_i1.p1 TRINITY_DN1176_c0_g1~~TRINITY_DN1176_c0_g1_i1.p1  ORF type:complete len:683 (-),score=282.08 TRINITY_DN1176_c0_g1_i1:70-2118(-)
MASVSESRIDELVAQKQAKADLVRRLKESGDQTEALENAIRDLKIVANELEQLTKGAREAEEAERKKLSKFREDVEDLCKRRFIFTPSFEIYGGVGGLYDYGPIGTTLKENFLQLWRRHFVLEEDMLEIQTVCMTPEVVLKASGHVDRFTDLMVKDEKTGDCYRADKLLEAHIDKLLEEVTMTSARRAELQEIHNHAGTYNEAQMAQAFQSLGIVSPDSGNPLSDPFPYNLMFATSIGPTGRMRGFLRPETAQGIFTNFRRLLEANNNRMPFAAAQIGLAFRNEIAPRSGLLRVREFQMAEIEHFVNPDDKKHPKFDLVADIVLNLLPRSAQEGSEEKTIPMTVGQAVAERVIDNETLGYYLARTGLFLQKIGIKADRLRFRQHKATEMAHYAKDCWDAEIHSSYGWVECVGHADRSCYDLQMHARDSKQELTAHEIFPEPQWVEVVKHEFNRGALGRTFRKDQTKIVEYIQELSKEDALAVESTLESTGQYTFSLCTGESFTITRDMVKISVKNEKIHSRKYIPSVVEPSFGIGRILYSIIEHSLWTRPEDEQRKVLSFPALVAPIKCSVLPLSGNDVFTPFVRQLYRGLLDAGLSTKVDDSSAALGRRYARTDEIGVPFGITVDFQTVQDSTVTIRERDSTSQIRIPIPDVVPTIRALVEGETTWPAVQQRFPKFEQQDI